MQNRRTIDLVRVCIGKRCSHTACSLQIASKGQKIRLTYTWNGRKVDHHVIQVEDIQQFKYFESSTKDVVLAILRVNPTTKENGLGLLPNKYLSDFGRDKEAIRTKGYIVLEMRSCEDLKRFMAWMGKSEELQAYVADENEALDEDECKQYAGTMLALLEAERQQREECTRSSSKRRKTRKGDQKQVNNEIMLVFPFGGNEEEVDAAADGLTEAKQVVDAASTKTNGYDKLKCAVKPAPQELLSNDVDSGYVSGKTNEVPDTMSLNALAKDGDGEAAGVADSEGADSEGDTEYVENQGMPAVVGFPREPDMVGDESDDMARKADPGKKKPRAHFLTVRQEDFDRLEVGEFLNDTLIDFWMQW